jgi:Trk-type K+ transport system membrane component
MFFADLLNLLAFPIPLGVLLAAFAWYHVFRPPKGERFTRLRKRAIRRREMLRAFWLLIALCVTLVLAAVVYSELAG